MKTTGDLFSNGYYIMRNGAQEGPFTLKQIRGMWNAGALTADVMFFKAEYGDWLALETIIGELEERQKSATNIPSAPAPLSLKISRVLVALNVIAAVGGAILILIEGWGWLYALACCLGFLGNALMFSFVVEAFEMLWQILNKK